MLQETSIGALAANHWIKNLETLYLLPDIFDTSSIPKLRIVAIMATVTIRHQQMRTLGQ